MAESVVDNATYSLLQGQLAASVNQATLGANYILETLRQSHQAAIEVRSAVALKEMSMSGDILRYQAAMDAPRRTADPTYIPVVPTTPK